MSNIITLAYKVRLDVATRIINAQKLIVYI